MHALVQLHANRLLKASANLVFASMSYAARLTETTLPIRQTPRLFLEINVFSSTPVLVTGVQIATKQIDEGIAAGQLAAEAGAAWMDLNCGCPIYGRQSSQFPVISLSHASTACAPLTTMLLSCDEHLASLLQWACELSMTHLKHKLAQHVQLSVDCPLEVMHNGTVL